MYFQQNTQNNVYESIINKVKFSFFLTIKVVKIENEMEFYTFYFNDYSCFP